MIRVEEFIAEELMVEEKSRLSILVVENRDNFAENAKEALRGHDVTFVSSWSELFCQPPYKMKYDAILSGSYVLNRNTWRYESTISEVLRLVRETGTPACFVVRTDHKGRCDCDGWHITLKAINQETALQMQTKKSRKGRKSSEYVPFEKLKTTQCETNQCPEKISVVWGMALNMALNAKKMQVSVESSKRKVAKGSIVSGRERSRVVPKK